MGSIVDKCCICGKVGAIGPAIVITGGGSPVCLSGDCHRTLWKADEARILIEHEAAKAQAATSMARKSAVQSAWGAF